jgi:ketosteroid isomerase-like protein
MSQHPVTASALELTRSVYACLNDREFDAVADMFSARAVWDVSRWGLGIHSGRAAVRRFLGDWFESLEEFKVEVEEMLDLGSGVVYVEVLQIARRAGSREYLRLRSAPVYEWAEGKVARLTLYPDIDEGRAAAERTAQARDYEL